MAEFNFSDSLFGRKKPKKPATPPPEETSAEAPADADPLATPAESTDATDPFAAPADGSTEAAADPFATPAESTEAAADPFATPAEGSMDATDPFATPAESTDTPADPFATPSGGSTDTAADPFATPAEGSTDAAADPFATPAESTDAPAETPAETTETPSGSPALEASIAAVTIAPPKPRKVPPKTPFRILVMGDFSGRGSRGVTEPVAGRPLVKADIDNLENLPGKLSAALSLDDPMGAAEPIALEFSSLDDLHADQLLSAAPSVSRLKALRGQLTTPATAAKAAAELRKLFPGSQHLKKEKTAKAASGRGSESDYDTLTRLMGRAPAAAGATPVASPAEFAVQKMLEGILGPAGSAPAAGRKADTTAVDAALQAGLRGILSHPRYRNFEGNWRGLERIVQAAEEDTIKVAVLDLSPEELTAEATTGQEAGDSELGILLRDAGDQAPWGLVVAAYFFGSSDADLAQMRFLARLGHAIQAPVIAGGTGALAGVTDFATQADPRAWAAPETLPPAWGELRAAPEAGWLSLVAPRFIYRQPYGKGSEPIDAFPFEEVATPRDHESYPWGNGAFLVAELLARRFGESGWAMEPSLGGEIGGLAVHHFKDASGDTDQKPCGEAWLPERAAQTLQKRGLVAVISMKNADQVRLPILTTIAAEPAPLCLPRK